MYFLIITKLFLDEIIKEKTNWSFINQKMAIQALGRNFGRITSWVLMVCNITQLVLVKILPLLNQYLTGSKSNTLLTLTHQTLQAQVIKSPPPLITLTRSITKPTPSPGQPSQRKHKIKHPKTQNPAPQIHLPRKITIRMNPKITTH